MTVAADPRKPLVELRRRRRADGTVSVKSTVRWSDQDGTRRRRGFDTFEEADLERARLALELAQTGTIGGTKDNTLAALWPIYRADAVARLAEATIISYDRCWFRHLSPRFGDVPLDEITPRSVAQWRADMLAKGIGRETVRRAMVLLQAMFTLGVEWGEAERTLSPSSASHAKAGSARSRFLTRRPLRPSAVRSSPPETTSPPRW
jgi:hypothetical protein